jgi:plastocyanin
MLPKPIHNSLFPALVGLALTLLQSALAQELRVELKDTEGNALENAVVELILPAELKSSYQATLADEIDQRDKEFVPVVTVVPAGSEINFPNSDDILHHVYSFSPAKTFNIPLYGQGENDRFVEKFPEPGIVEIGCNIHDWMLAYIYVAESSLYALSDVDGVAELSGLPAGEFSLRVWHPRAADSLEALTQTVSLSADSTFSLSLSLELQRDRRVRRAPGANSRRYR